MIGSVLLIVPALIAAYLLYRAFVHHLANTFVAQHDSIALSHNRIEAGMNKLKERYLHWRAHRAAVVMSRYARHCRQMKALAAQANSTPHVKRCDTTELGDES